MASLSCAAERKSPAHFPYGSTAFETFVTDSYKLAGENAPQPFLAWMDAKLQKIQNQPWIAWVDTQRGNVQNAATDEKVGKEAETLLEIWRLIKQLLPNYSLTRGFEFTSAVRHAERQCFLQSVIVTSLLQACGFDAGIVMVNRNPDGEYTNNGHAVPLVRLSDGSSAMIDGSYPMPYPQHMSVFVLDTIEGKYQYVRPIYDQRGAVMGFRQGDATWGPRRAGGLDFDFLRSQFDYYRGERAIGGVLAKEPTAKGLSESIAHFQRGLERCKGNPLVVYMLGKALRAAGREEEAKAKFREAETLYKAYGWSPVNLRDELRR